MLKLSLWIPPLCLVVMIMSPICGMPIVRGGGVLVPFAFDGYLWKYVMIICKFDNL